MQTSLLYFMTADLSNKGHVNLVTDLAKPNETENQVLLFCVKRKQFDQFISIQINLYITFKIKHKAATQKSNNHKIFRNKIINHRSSSFFHFVKDIDPEMFLYTQFGTLVAEPGFQARQKAPLYIQYAYLKSCRPPGSRKVSLISC